MSTCKFTVSTGPQTIKKGDFVCLPFLNGKTPAFEKKLAPRKFANGTPPKKKGASETLFVGESGGVRVGARIYRLDGENSSPFREARNMISSALTQAAKLSLKRVVVIVDGAHGDICRGIQEGALIGGYVFDKYLSKKKKPLPVQMVVGARPSGPLKQALTRSSVLAGCVNFARDTLNEPPCEINPVTLAEAFKQFGSESGLAVKVWDEKRLTKENCNGILAVGKGSDTPPRLVIGEYKPKDPVCHLSLVGKGITFDSGGYSLKPPKSMDDMKLDMGGAAMMWGAASAIATLALPIQITVYTPLAHNAVSGGAYNVSDVIPMRSGLTVEVNNTDAEGRIILADALDIAGEANPDILIDSATLTGAAVVALGEDLAAVFGTDRETNAAYIEAGAAEGEDHWELPLHRPYKGQLDSTVADMKNTGERWGGSITAALFLQQFVKKDQKWIHADIAGPGCKQTPLDYLGKGAKGFGVKTIVAFAEQLCTR